MTKIIANNEFKIALKSAYLDLIQAGKELNETTPEVQIREKVFVIKYKGHRRVTIFAGRRPGVQVTNSIGHHSVIYDEQYEANSFVDYVARGGVINSPKQFDRLIDGLVKTRKWVEARIEGLKRYEQNILDEQRHIVEKYEKYAAMETLKEL